MPLVLPDPQISYSSSELNSQLCVRSFVFLALFQYLSVFFLPQKTWGGVQDYACCVLYSLCMHCVFHV